jgi:serine/threonine protein kinase
MFDFCIDIVKKQLGKGNGQVFLCEHKYTRIEYAIKCMDTKSFQEQTEMLKISNPFVVKYYGTFEEGNFKYFVMEYCKGKGGNLEQLIKNNHGEFTEEVLFIIFKKIFLYRK